MGKLFIKFILLFICFSCSTKKNILYVQDFDSLKTQNYSFEDYTINIDDILKIDIFDKSPELIAAFRTETNNFSNTKETLLYNGYQIKSDGLVSIPNVGEIYVIGLTISELRKQIFDMIVDSGELLNPTVDVKLLNAHFTILGEINKPGRYEFLKNNLNLFEALGIAGDLTINGKREDIKILRSIDGEITVNNVDLTKIEFINNNVFQIISGDIIIVNPNTTRVKNAGIIGNSGTLLSLLSFVLSTIIITTSN